MPTSGTTPLMLTRPCWISLSAARREQNMKNQIANLKKNNSGLQDKGQGGRKEKGKGKGKCKDRSKSKANGKGKGAGSKRKRPTRFIPMPAPLVGLDATDENGEPYCFDCALGTCTKAKWGARCPKGWLKCMAPGCKKMHAYVGNH